MMERDDSACAVGGSRLSSRCWLLDAGLGQRRRDPSRLILACSQWFVALHGHAVSLSLIVPVVPDRHVLRAAVVPHRDVVLAPVEAHLIPRNLGVLKKELQNRAAFFFR